MEPRTYLSRFPDGSIVRWKALTWQEYNHLVREFGEPDQIEGAAAWEFYSAAAALCVLDQQQDGIEVEFEELYAGTIFVTGQHIIKETGFYPGLEDVKAALAVARARVKSSFYETAKAYVCVAMHKTIEEVEQMDRDTFMYYLAMVEQATGNAIEVGDSTEKETGKPTRFIQGPDGRPIPLLTKADATQKRRIDLVRDAERFKREVG